MHDSIRAVVPNLGEFLGGGGDLAISGGGGNGQLSKTIQQKLFGFKKYI